MKKQGLWMSLMAIVFVAGCSSTSPNQSEAGSKTYLQLDSKHAALPDYVKQATPIVQETYAMAAKDPDALAAVPCYCGCGKTNGHKSNLDCFVKNIGSNKEVLEWDPMGAG